MNWSLAPFAIRREGQEATIGTKNSVLPQPKAGNTKIKNAMAVQSPKKAKKT